MYIEDQTSGSQPFGLDYLQKMQYIIGVPCHIFDISVFDSLTGAISSLNFSNG